MWARYVYHFIFLYTAHTLATIFHFELAQKKSCLRFAYSSNLQPLAYTAHTVTNRQIFCALLAYAAHAVANC
jgi:hypothetical protein